MTAPLTPVELADLLIERSNNGDQVARFLMLHALDAGRDGDQFASKVHEELVNRGALAADEEVNHDWLTDCMKLLGIEADLQAIRDEHPLARSWFCKA